MLTTTLTAVYHTLAIYIFLIVVLGHFGRRNVSQFTVVQYLIIAMLGSAVESGLYAGSGGLAPGLASAATILIVNRALSAGVARSERLHRFIVGSPILLVRDGQIIWPHLKRSRMTEEDVMQAIRLRGYGDLDQVRFAVLEADGTVGVIPREG